MESSNKRTCRLQQFLKLRAMLPKLLLFILYEDVMALGLLKVRSPALSPTIVCIENKGRGLTGLCSDGIANDGNVGAFIVDSRSFERAYALNQSFVCMAPARASPAETFIWIANRAPPRLRNARLIKSSTRTR
jgi:hypothetical protein